MKNQFPAQADGYSSQLSAVSGQRSAQARQFLALANLELSNTLMRNALKWIFISRGQDESAIALVIRAAIIDKR